MFFPIAYLIKAYTIKVVKMKSMETPAPTNTISSKENGSKYNKLSPKAPVFAGFLTFCTKETKQHINLHSLHCVQCTMYFL